MSYNDKFITVCKEASFDPMTGEYSKAVTQKNYVLQLHKIYDDLKAYEEFDEGELEGFILEIDDINDRLNDDSTDDEFHMMNQCEDLIGEIEIYFANIDAECELECIRDEQQYLTSEGNH